MEKIQGGMLKDISDYIKNISDKLFKIVDKILDIGAEVEQTENGFIIKGEIGDSDATVEVLQSATKDGYFDVNIKHKSGKSEKCGTFSTEDLGKYLNEKFGIDTVKSSRKLQVTLQKIVSSDTIDVRLTAINSNYDVKASMDDLDLLLSDDEFIDQLSEEPMSFEMVDEEDTFDVTSIDGVDTSSSIQHMLGSAILLWANMKELMWNTLGLDMEEVQCRIQSCLYTIESEIDMLAGLCVELNQKVPNPLDVAVDYNHTSTKAGYGKEIAYMYLYDEIMTYVSVLDMFYVNFSHDVQAELDRMIRCWKREADRIGRSTIDPMLPISSR